MKVLVFLSLAMAFLPGLAMADLQQQAATVQALFGNPTEPYQITKTQFNVAETRPKAVLKGVYYFGGIDSRGKITAPLSDSYVKNKLCANGFSKVYGVYARGTSDCLEYKHIGEAVNAPNGGAAVAELMQSIFNVIRDDGKAGPIYLHCAYGVHASNTISEMVLKQFCGTPDNVLLSNWDKVNYLNSLPPDKVKIEKAKVLAYKPNPSFLLTEEQKRIVCYPDQIGSN